MAYEFVKLNEVDLVEEPNEGANVIIEEDGEIKRVPKTAIGAQADWNETDETNPAFILNKPTRIGGYLYYCYTDYTLYKCEDHNFNTEEAKVVTKEEFEADYYSNPILFLNSDQPQNVAQIIAYRNDYRLINYLDRDGNLTAVQVSSL